VFVQIVEDPDDKVLPNPKWGKAVSGHGRRGSRRQHRLRKNWPSIQVLDKPLKYYAREWIALY
jgi:hypothetical protein